MKILVGMSEAHVLARLLVRDNMKIVNALRICTVIPLEGLCLLFYQSLSPVCTSFCACKRFCVCIRVVLVVISKVIHTYICISIGHLCFYFCVSVSPS